ncbi:MAG: PEP-CTERM sorting domain-containing protein, partial [Akkermansia sp.]|nr:PEP-CTERM sorting domain-containing protein [Akkermansia sp.]
EGATLKLGNNGIVNIKGTAGSTTSAVSSSNTGGGAKYLITGTDGNGGNAGAYTISNAEVSVDTSSAAQTISNILSNSKLINNGSYKLVSDNTASTYSAIDATKGSIDILNAQNQTLGSLTIGGGKTVGLYIGDTVPAAPTSADEATVTTSSLTVGGTGATLNANLVLSDGATVKLAAALTMGSSVTLGEGMILSGDLVSTIKTMSEDGIVDLFTGVDKLYLGDSTVASVTLDATSGVNLSEYFNFDGASDYYLGYDGTNVFAGVMPVPEPTTATLSLLALAGLAARRRRK